MYGVSSNDYQYQANVKFPRPPNVSRDLGEDYIPKTKMIIYKEQQATRSTEETKML